MRKLVLSIGGIQFDRHYVIVGKNPEAILLAAVKTEIFRRLLHESCSGVAPIGLPRLSSNQR